MTRVASERRLTVETVPPSAPAASFAEDVRRGLTAQPKWLSCRFFYDREGSRLFERICDAARVLPDPRRGRDPDAARGRDRRGGAGGRHPGRARQRERGQDPPADRGPAAPAGDAPLRPDRHRPRRARGERPPAAGRVRGAGDPRPVRGVPRRAAPPRRPAPDGRARPAAADPVAGIERGQLRAARGRGLPRAGAGDDGAGRPAAARRRPAQGARRARAGLRRRRGRDRPLQQEPARPRQPGAGWPLRPARVRPPGGLRRGRRPGPDAPGEPARSGGADRSAGTPRPARGRRGHPHRGLLQVLPRRDPGAGGGGGPGGRAASGWTRAGASARASFRPAGDTGAPRPEDGRRRRRASTRSMRTESPPD